MDTVVRGYRGLSLLVNLNWDRLFFLGTIVVGLLAGAFLGSALISIDGFRLTFARRNAALSNYVPAF